MFQLCHAYKRHFLWLFIFLNGVCKMRSDENIVEIHGSISSHSYNHHWIKEITIKLILFVNQKMYPKTFQHDRSIMRNVFQDIVLHD